MSEHFRNINSAWTPEHVVQKVPEKNIQHVPMFLRRGNYADNDSFIEVAGDLFPQARRRRFEDGESFKGYLADVAHRPDDIILAVLEATTVIVPHTCLDALQQGLRIVDRTNRLHERVIPVLVVDQDWAHTKFFRATSRNLNGPQEVLERGRRLGAVTVLVTPQTLRDRLHSALQGILEGVLPSNDFSL